MKLLSIHIARAVWFFHLNDLNPRGKAIERDLLSGIGQRYSFAKMPGVQEIIEARQKNTGIQATSGIFKSPSGLAIDVELTMYRDAIFADTRSSTTDSEAFITDMLDWLTQEMGMLDHRTIRINKIYVSELYVQLDKSLNFINPAFERFTSMLRTNIKSPTKDLNFEAGALQFWIDPALKHAHVPFRMERQEGIPFSENRYYSMAPLETDEHLKAIEMLEKTMGK